VKNEAVEKLHDRLTFVSDPTRSNKKVNRPKE
jgi:hypothetical protein